MTLKFKSSFAIWLLSCAAFPILLSSAWAQPAPLPVENAAKGAATKVIDEVKDDSEQTADEEIPSEEDTSDDHGHESVTPETVDFVFTEAPDDHVLGDDKAPITMIVYASVTCSHCSDWFTNQWPALKKDLVDSGKMRFILRPLPTPPAQMSMLGFMIAECAPAEDYFDVIQYQMENQLRMFKQAEVGKARAEYDKVARLAGLEDDAAVKGCLEDLDRLNHIHKNGFRATAAKVQGVPAFFINGDTYKGKQSADALTKLILDMSEQRQSKLPTTLP